MDRNLRQPRKIPSTFIDDLRDRVDIVALISEKLPLKKAGHNYMACCPFHQEKSPSFTVNAQKHFYHCFGCGAHGDVIDFIQNTEHLSFMDAVTRLAMHAGIPLPQESLEPVDDAREILFETLARVSSFYAAQLRHSPNAIEYLKNRKITGLVAKQFGLGYAPNEWDACLKNCGADQKSREALMTTGMLVNNDTGRQWDRFRDRVMFPIRDKRGRTIAFGGRVLGSGEPKYLNSPAGPTFNKSQCLYGEYENQVFQTQGPLIIVEGYMDVVALISNGFKAVASMGTALTVEHLERLFKRQDEFILCFDGDAAGQRAAARTLEVVFPLMEDGRCLKFLTLPPDEDPDSYIQHFGAAGFQALIDKAVPLSEFFFQSKLAQMPLDNIDTRARFSKEIKLSLAKLPQGAFKTLMYEALDDMLFARKRSAYPAFPSQDFQAAKKNLEPSAWSGRGGAGWKQKTGQMNYPQEATPPALWTPEIVLLHLMLHCPDFRAANEVPLLMKTSLPSLLPIKALVGWLEERSGTLEQRLECVAPFVSTAIKEALIKPPLIDAQTWVAEWEGAIAQLLQRMLKEQTAFLLQQSSKGDLSEAQKNELQALLKLKTGQQHRKSPNPDSE